MKYSTWSKNRWPTTTMVKAKVENPGCERGAMNYSESVRFKYLKKAI